ncbi:cytochrome b [Bosea sp. (in: a-proteobacteria)]|jgi:cytochrome b561|uniref:cytochrome b n=1 Tax=Bosea sp. (in: a-proteobacteria) TaxID=1871050 RepID=UPI003F718764
MTMLVSSGYAESASGLPAQAAARRPFPMLAKLLHWTTALLVFCLFSAGVLMKQIGDGPMADALYTLHKSAGALLFGLVLVRMSHRVLTKLTGRWHRDAGNHAVHGVLYAALILVPLLGWAGVSDFGARGLYFGLSLPAIWPEGAGYSELLFKSHAWLAFALIALVVLHIGIALGDYIQRGAGRQATAAAKMPQPEGSSPAPSNMP